MSNETPKNYCGHVVPRWQNDPDGRKRVRQLQDRLKEFKQQLQNAQAAILEHTDELYLERQKQLFQGTVSAIEHVEVVLNFASHGCIAVPEGWQKPPSQ